jgi:hypothetical protein
MKAECEDFKRGEAFSSLGNDRTIRDSPEFSDIWRLNFPIEERSTRGRIQNWGIPESTIFHRKICEYSQAVGVPGNNSNLAKQKYCSPVGSKRWYH